MDLTKWLALWGSILSTVAVTWNIFRGLQDRKKIKVEAHIGIIIPGDVEKKVFYSTMTNVGRRPVYITGWGLLIKRSKGEIKKRGRIIMGRNIPMMLKDGEYNLEYTEDLSTFSDELITVQVWDSAGNKWKISRKNLKQLLKEAADLPH